MSKIHYYSYVPVSEAVIVGGALLLFTGVGRRILAIVLLALLIIMFVVNCEESADGERHEKCQATCGEEQYYHEKTYHGFNPDDYEAVQRHNFYVNACMDRCINDAKYTQ